MYEKFDFSPGRITFNNYRVDSNADINPDNDSLTEDMFQVEYPGDLVIDAGWYSGINKFIIYVVKNGEWEKPLIRLECGTVEELNKGMSECIYKFNEWIVNKGFS